MESQRREVLKFENISLTYHTKDDEILALKNVNFSVYEGEFVAIVGPSGCGKTTLLSLISGILTPSSGKIFLDGKEITKTKNTSAKNNILKNLFRKKTESEKEKLKLIKEEKKLEKKNRSSEIGYMFQRDQLFDWRTIWKNVTLGLEVQGKKKNAQLKEKLENLLTKYGLGPFKNKKPTQLSGGMRQRVALIRTLALNPKLLLLDEPFSALDFQTRLSVCDSVSEIIASEQKTAILVTHDIAEAISMADRIIILTTRPGTVKKVVSVNLKSLGPPIKRRESETARTMFDEIWKDLIVYNENELASDWEENK